MAHTDILIIGDLAGFVRSEPLDPRRRKERQDYAMFPERSNATANLPEKPIYRNKGF